MATYNVKEIDMDIKAITDFLDMVDHDCKIDWTRRRISEGKQCYLNWREELESKQRAFEICVMECYMNHQQGANIPMSIYADRLAKALHTIDNSFMAKYDKPKPIDSLPRKQRDVCRYDRSIRCAIVKASDYLDKMKKLYDGKSVVDNSINDDKASSIDVHYTINITENKLKSIFQYLIGNDYLDKDTLITDFVYYFTGKGTRKNNGLKWTSKKGCKVKLAYFINTIIKGGRDQDKSYWKKAEIIFGVKGLANSYSMSYSNNDNTSNEQFVEDIEKLLK